MGQLLTVYVQLFTVYFYIEIITSNDIIDIFTIALVLFLSDLEIFEINQIKATMNLQF